MGISKVRNISMDAKGSLCERIRVPWSSLKVLLDLKKTLWGMISLLTDVYENCGDGDLASPPLTHYRVIVNSNLIIFLSCITGRLPRHERQFLYCLGQTDNHTWDSGWETGEFLATALKLLPQTESCLIIYNIHIQKDIIDTCSIFWFIKYKSISYNIKISMIGSHI